MVRGTIFALACAVVMGSRSHRAGKGDDSHKSLKSRLEKFDRLMDMAVKGKVENSVPDLKERIEQLKQREAALLEAEDSLEAPKMPVIEGNPFSHDPAELHEDLEDFMPDVGKMIRGEKQEDDEEELTPEEKAERDMHMKRVKERMEKIKDMTTEERLAFMREERESGALSDSIDPAKFSRKRKKHWKSKTGDFGPPTPQEEKQRKRKEAMMKLTKEERHAHIRAHQAAMQDHRDNMANWRETHASYMDERRDIMDAYRTMSHEIRDAIFANRDL